MELFKFNFHCKGSDIKRWAENYRAIVKICRSRKERYIACPKKETIPIFLKF